MSSVFPLLPSVETALSELQGVTTLGGFTSLVNSLSATATSANGGVVYGGPFSVPGAPTPIDTSEVAPDIASQLQWSVLNDTARGQFLNQPEVQAQLTSILESSGQFDTLEAAEVAAGNLIGGIEGDATSLSTSYFGQASEQFAASLSGDVLFIGPNSPEGRIFGQVELPALLANSKITSINGVPISDLTGNSFAFTDIVDAAQAIIGTDGIAQVTSVGSPSGINYELTLEAVTRLNTAAGKQILNPADFKPFASLAEVAGTGSLPEATEASGELQSLSAAAAPSEAGLALDGASSINIGSIGSGALKVLGVAGIAYDVVTSSAQAAAQVQNGNTSGAVLTLTDLAARLEFGIEGAEAGALGAGALFSETGIGAVAAAVIGGVAGGIAGAVGGQAAVDSIWSGAQAVINTITGNSSQNLATTPDAALQPTFNSLISSGVTSTIADETTNLIHSDWVTQSASSPTLTEAQDAANVASSVQQNQAVAVSAGTGPTVEVDVNPTSSITTSSTLFSSTGTALATSILNGDSSGSAVSFSTDGIVLQGAAYQPDGSFGAILLNSLPSTTSVAQSLSTFNGAESQVSTQTTTSTNGGISSAITGSGVSTDLSNAQVTVAPGASATVTGTADTVNLGDSSSVVVTGAGNVINTGLNDVVAASNATINVGPNASGTSQSDVTNIQGSGNTIAGATNATLNVNGDTNNIGLATGETLTLSGTEEEGGDTGNMVTTVGGDTLTLNYNISGEGYTPNTIVTSTGTGNILNLTGDFAFATITGDSITLDLTGENAQAAVTGANNSFQLSGEFAGVAITGNNNSFQLTGEYSTARVTGNDETFSLGTGSSADLQGVGEYVAALSSYIALENDSTAIVNGGHNSLSLLDDADATVTGSINSIDLFGNSAFATVTGYSNSFDLSGQYAHANVNGNGNQFNLTGQYNVARVTGNDNSFDLTGQYGFAAATGNDEFLILSAGSGAYLQGLGEKVTASGGYITLDNDSTATVTGNTNILSLLGDDSSVTADGNNDTSSLGSSDSATFNGTGEQVTATGDTVTLGNSSTATITGAGNTLSDGTGDTETVDGNNNALTLGTGDTATLSGTGETVSATSDTVLLGNSSTVTVIGAGDVFDGALSNTIVTALNDTVNASNATIEAGSNSTTVSGITTIDGTSDIVDGPSGSVVSLDDDALGTANTLGSAGLVTSIASNQTLFTVASDTDETIITAQNDMVDASNDTIEAGSNSSTVGGVTTIEGTGNSISGPSGSVLALGDVGSTSTLTSAGLTAFTANNETVNSTASGDTIITALNNTVNANNDVIEAGSNGSDVSGTTIIEGTGDSIEGPSGSVVSLGEEIGSLNTLASPDLDVSMANGETLSTITAATGETIVTASSDTVDATDSTIEVGFNSTTGSGTTNIGGTGDSISGTNGSVVALDAMGSSNTLTSSGLDVFTANNETVTSTASGDTIITASNNEIVASDDDIRAEANTNSVTGVTHVDGTDDTISTPNDSALDVAGNDNQVHLGTDDTVNIAGSDETIFANDDTIDFGGSDTDGDTIVGTGNTEEGDGSGLPPDGDGGDGGDGGYGGYGGGYDAVPAKGKSLATTTLRTVTSSSIANDQENGLQSRLGWSDPALISMSDDGWATTGRVVGEMTTSELGLGPSAGVVASAPPETPTQAAARIVLIQRGSLQTSAMRAPASGLSASVSSGVDRLVQAMAALPGRSAATTPELAAEASIVAESQLARPWSLDKLHVARPMHLP